MSRRERAEHLYDWQRAGIFPAMHDDITRMVHTVVAPSAGLVLDLGSSTGLLSRRLSSDGYDTRGIEANASAIAAGSTAGTYSPSVPVRHWALNSTSGTDLAEQVRAWRVHAVVAHRSLARLDESGLAVESIGAALADAGVRHLLVEERALRSHLDRLADRWTVAAVDGVHLAHLTPAE